MAGKPKYTNAIIAFVAAFALFLVGMDVLLVLEEREDLYAEFDYQTKNELSLIGTFVTEPLLEQQFAVVEQFILQWGEEKLDIIELRALSPGGYTLAEFKRPFPQENSRSFRHNVVFMNHNLLSLLIVKDLSPVNRHLKEFWKHLILQSLVILGVFGTILWFILKSLALRPLEEEINRRKTREVEKEKLVEELQEALKKVKTLSGFLPICATCKKIRDDQGYWKQVELYISEHSEAEFSHGICPDCMKENYPKTHERIYSKKNG